MDPWQDLKTWSKRHREEALQEARAHHLADRAGTRRALAGTHVLSLVHGVGLSE